MRSTKTLTRLASDYSPAQANPNFTIDAARLAEGGQS